MPRRPTSVTLTRSTPSRCAPSGVGPADAVGGVDAKRVRLDEPALRALERRRARRQRRPAAGARSGRRPGRARSARNGARCRRAARCSPPAASAGAAAPRSTCVAVDDERAVAALAVLAAIEQVGVGRQAIPVRPPGVERGQRRADQCLDGTAGRRRRSRCRRGRRRPRRRASGEAGSGHSDRTWSGGTRRVVRTRKTAGGGAAGVRGSRLRLTFSRLRLVPAAGRVAGCDIAGRQAARR